MVTFWLPFQTRPPTVERCYERRRMEKLYTWQPTSEKGAKISPGVMFPF